MANQKKSFFQKCHPFFFRALPMLVGVQIVFAIVLFWEATHRKLPIFQAASSNNEMIQLKAHASPSVLPGVLLKWASKAAVSSYTFDFVNFEGQIAAAKKWFTATGWVDYKASLAGLIESIATRQLFVNSVISGTPVIASTDDLGWNIQLPFLVTYQSSDETSRMKFLVKMRVVKVPALFNSAGISVDGFVMGRG